tara:strand:- start:96 stop:335 length:240 start_codon:yes stop_codon:yes gene_type:complete
LNIPGRVDGAYQDGNILNIFQLPVNRVYAKAGMYVQIATGESAELKKLTADVVVNSYGKAKIENINLLNIFLHHKPLLL